MPESGGGTCLPRDPMQPQDQGTAALIRATKLPDEVLMEIILERLFAAWCSPQMHKVSLLVSYCALGTALGPLWPWRRKGVNTTKALDVGIWMHIPSPLCLFGSSGMKKKKVARGLNVLAPALECSPTTHETSTSKTP